MINVISLAGLGAPPGEALYAATKHGAIAFTLGTLADLRRSGLRGVQVSAVCPDGIWTPMLHDKLDDPDAAPSFSGVLLRPEDVAAARRRRCSTARGRCSRSRAGAASSCASSTPSPGSATRLLPLWMRDAQRRQRRWKKRIESGRGP